MSSKTTFLKTLNPQKSISIAILAVVVIVVLWFLWEKISVLVSNLIDGAKQSSQDAINYGTASPTTDFESLAIQIYSAMKGWGTDEDAVESVLSQIKSNADYAALRRAYKNVQKDNFYTTLDSRIAFEGNKKELARWAGILDGNGVTIYTFYKN